MQRHQTLRAAIDWSYELLSEPERRAAVGVAFALLVQCGRRGKHGYINAFAGKVIHVAVVCSVPDP